MGPSIRGRPAPGGTAKARPDEDPSMAPGDVEPGDGRAGPDSDDSPGSRDRPDARDRTNPWGRPDSPDGTDRRPDQGPDAAQSPPRRWSGRSIHAGYLGDGERGGDGFRRGPDCVTVADVVFALVRDPFDT